jgi:hypothetical protein
MESRDIKIIIIGTIISLIVNQFIIFIHTLIDFLRPIEFEIPLTGYFLFGYFPLAIAGIYIGITKSNKKITISILVGLLYSLSNILYGYYDMLTSNFPLYFPEHLEMSTTLKIISGINFSLLYVLLIAGSCAITSYIKERYFSV